MNMCKSRQAQEYFMKRIKEVSEGFFLILLLFLLSSLFDSSSSSPAVAQTGSETHKAIDGVIHVRINTIPDGVDIYDDRGNFKAKSTKDIQIKISPDKDVVLYAIEKNFKEELDSQKRLGFKNHEIRIPAGYFKEEDGFMRSGNLVYNFPKNGWIKLIRWNFFEQNGTILIVIFIILAVALSFSVILLKKRIKLFRMLLERRTITDRDLGEIGEMTGKHLSGKYEIARLIGKGGMARVYQGWKALSLSNIDDRFVKDPVAIKIMLPRIAEDPDFQARFKREIEASQQLIHPRIIQGYDWGEDDSLSILYIVMELLDGQSLSSLLKQNASLEMPQALTWGLETLEGLQFAHNKGVIHRDLNPNNIFVTKSNHVKILDFGLAKKTDAKTITKTGNVLGTPGYISPEQATGEKIDHRTDLYSFGIVLYAMLAGGELPFKGSNEIEIIINSLSLDPIPLRSVNANVPEQVEKVVNRLISKNADDRYQSANEASEALKAAAGECGLNLI